MQGNDLDTPTWNARSAMSPTNFSNGAFVQSVIHDGLGVFHDSESYCDPCFMKNRKREKMIDLNRHERGNNLGIADGKFAILSRGSAHATGTSPSPAV